MKRIVKIILCVVILGVFIQPVVMASDTTTIEGINDQYEELLEQSEAEKLVEVVPNDAEKILKDSKISIDNAGSLLDLRFTDFLKNIATSVKELSTKPLMILLSTIGIILLCSLLNSLKTGFNNSSYGQIFSVVSVVCIATTIIIPIANIVTHSSTVIKQVSRFMLSFVPIYAGIITAGSKPISAVTYQLSLVSVVQIIAEIAASVLVPLLAIYLAFCLIGATSTKINIEGIAKGVKTTVTVVLGFLLTVFIGLLTVQGVVASSADTLTIKTAKFALSTFLPVVGSAMSEALNSLQGCMGMIKSTVGGFSIFVLVASFLPSIITIVLMQLSLSIAACVSDILETKGVSSLLRSANSVMSILLGIMITFFLMLTISIGIMLTL